MTTKNDYLKSLPLRQMLAFHDFSILMTQAHMNKIRAIKALRSVSGGLTGESIGLWEAKAIIDFCYQARFNNLVMEHIPNALSARDAASVAELHAEKDFLERTHRMEVRL